MKFCKNLLSVVELSDPEWGPFWMNYKILKKKINDIVVEKSEAMGKCKTATSEENHSQNNSSGRITKSPAEIEFFRFLMHELKKTSDFFASSEELYKIRRMRLIEGMHMLQEKEKRHDKNTWTRLLMACVRFYKDVLLLENYAIMHFCGFSKILKKHDKMTGYSTRDAFIRNVLRTQNFVEYPYILELLRDSERLFEEIQSMESVMPLQDEERLFIEAIRDLNYQASRLHAEERGTTDARAASSAAPASESAGIESGNHSIYEGMTEAALKAKKAHENVSVNASPNFQNEVSWIQDNLHSFKARLGAGFEQTSDASSASDEDVNDDDEEEETRRKRHKGDDQDDSYI